MRGRDLRHSVSPEPADFFVDPRRYVIRGAVTQDDEALRRVVAFYNADRVRPPEGIITTVIEAVQQRGVTPRWPVVLFHPNKLRPPPRHGAVALPIPQRSFLRYFVLAN